MTTTIATTASSAMVGVFFTTKMEPTKSPLWLRTRRMKDPRFVRMVYCGLNTCTCKRAREHVAYQRLVCAPIRESPLPHRNTYTQRIQLVCARQTTSRSIHLVLPFRHELVKLTLPPLISDAPHELPSISAMPVVVAL